MGNNFPKEILKEGFINEADKLNLVRSELEDTMCEAYHEIRQIWRSREDVPDLRTAAYILAIDSVAKYYIQYNTQSDLRPDIFVTEIRRLRGNADVYWGLSLSLSHLCTVVKPLSWT